MSLSTNVLSRLQWRRKVEPTSFTRGAIQTIKVKMTHNQHTASKVIPLTEHRTRTKQGEFSVFPDNCSSKLSILVSDYSTSRSWVVRARQHCCPYKQNMTNHTMVVNAKSGERFARRAERHEAENKMTWFSSPNYDNNNLNFLAYEMM